MYKDVVTINPLTEQLGRNDPKEGNAAIPTVDVTSEERDFERNAEKRDKIARAAEKEDKTVQSTEKRKNEEGIPLTAVAARIASAGKTMKKITEAMTVALQTEKTEDIDIDYSSAILDDAMLTIDEDREEEEFLEKVAEMGGTVEEPTQPVEEKPERIGNPLTLEEIFTGSSEKEKEPGKEDKDGMDEIGR